MGFVIDRTMVSRLVGLSREVSSIDPSSDRSAQSKTITTVTVNGKDEVALLATEINQMLGTIRRHGEAMSDIVDNVSFGFFICDLQGNIGQGLTKSSDYLLNQDPKSLIGQNITKALAMTPKESEWFMTLYAQLCEDIFPEDTSISQMPSRFVIGSGESTRVVRLQGRLLRHAQDNTPRGVLFSLADITDLERAEIENREAKTLLKIMQSPKAFIDFISDLKSQLANLDVAIASGDHKVSRRILHTLKGNFSCFYLEMIARRIHEIEDKPSIDASDIKEIESLARNFLAKHKSILAISYDAPNAVEFTLTEENLKALEQLATSTTQSADQKTVALKEFISDIKKINAAGLLGPLDDMVQQTASRLGKTITFALEGGDVRVDPYRFKAVSEILPHLIRNSIDHGIEDSEDRMDNDKPLSGEIRLEIRTVQSSQSGILVRLSDDGKGIATDKVAQKALAMGLVTPAQLSAMTDDQKAELIFQDALSTADSVSEISGRGFGLSAVKDTIEKSGGKVSIINQPGKGCTFELFVPYQQPSKATLKAAA